MRSQQVEARVLDVVESVLAGGRAEDSRVELKADWPTDHARAARQIAGLANAARGDDVLWIIGVDESAHALRPPREVDLADWWAQVQGRFGEGIYPDLEDFRVPVIGGGVHVLVFETSRAPYVVTTDGRGGVDCYVPWRDGTRTRSARRSDLLRVLVRASRVPDAEPISGSLQAGQYSGDVNRAFINGDMRFFFSARERVFLPEHLWEGIVHVGGARLPFRLWAHGSLEHLREPDDSQGFPRSRSVPRGDIEYVNGSGLDVRGPGAMRVQFQRALDDAATEAVMASQDQAEVQVKMPLDQESGVVLLQMRLAPVPIGQGPSGSVSHRWEFSANL